jgi:hypothetical protein
MQAESFEAQQIHADRHKEVITSSNRGENPLFESIILSV